MAVPIAFKPEPIDPRDGLRKRLLAAPDEHAEALLVGYDLLQAAHDQGILDLLHGMIAHRDTIVEHLAEGAKKRESIDAMRNAIALGRMLSAIDPEVLSCVVAGFTAAAQQRRSEPASLWQLFRRVISREGRAGLTLAVDILLALGTHTSN